jgi:hypothetical protein
VVWDSLVQHSSLESIMNDKGLAKIGDNLVNFCYSLAKSVVLGEATGEKVRDSVLARALRATPAYPSMGRRTDAGRAADAYEAIMAYLWLTDKLSIPGMVTSLKTTLNIDSRTNRKREGDAAAISFQILLEQNLDSLPP